MLTSILKKPLFQQQRWYDPSPPHRFTLPWPLNRLKLYWNHLVTLHILVIQNFMTPPYIFTNQYFWDLPYPIPKKMIASLGSWTSFLADLICLRCHFAVVHCMVCLLFHPPGGVGGTQYKRPYGDVLPTWAAKSASWYMNDPLKNAKFGIWMGQFFKIWATF